MSQLTFVEEGIVTTAEIEEHGDVLQKYHEIWYQAGAYTWGYTQWLGVGVMKSPNDMWAYQEIMVQHRPRTVIETGTYQGGSALWLASVASMIDLDCHVYTVDIDDFRKCAHRNITFIRGDSTDPGLARDLEAQIEYPLLVILDADHSTEHVYKELCLYAPMCQIGDRLTVEDTNISWSSDRGAAGGVDDYLKDHRSEWRQDLMPERWLLTMNPGGWLQRVAEYKNER